MGGAASTALMGVNPARAGMIPFCLFTVWNCEGKPRASGDDPWAEFTHIAIWQ